MAVSCGQRVHASTRTTVLPLSSSISGVPSERDEDKWYKTEKNNNNNNNNNNNSNKLNSISYF